MPNARLARTRTLYDQQDMTKPHDHWPDDTERHEAQSVNGDFDTPCGVDGCSVCGDTEGAIEDEDDRSFWAV